MLALYRRRCLYLFLRVSVLTCWGLAGCASNSSLSEMRDTVAKAAKPYKIDVIQGNVVTREQRAALQPGMQRAVVRDILGTSLLTSVFHADRWDYVFTLRRAGVDEQVRKVTVFFKADVVDRIEADDLPSESEFVATLKSDAKPGKLPALEATEEGLKKFPVAHAPAPAAAITPATPPNYPPLEPSGK
jgi:outer membrane protein assembly factor BamE